MPTIGSFFAVDGRGVTFDGIDGFDWVFAPRFLRKLTRGGFKLAPDMDVVERII